MIYVCYIKYIYHTAALLAMTQLAACSDFSVPGIWIMGALLRNDKCRNATLNLVDVPNFINESSLLLLCDDIDTADFDNLFYIYR